MGKVIPQRKKWERFQNSRKGYSMTISELEMGRKGKGKESFQSLPFKEIAVFCELTCVHNARYFKFLKLTSYSFFFR